MAIAHFFDSSIIRSIPSTRLMPITMMISGASACQSIVGAVKSDAWARRVEIIYPMTFRDG